MWPLYPSLLPLLLMLTIATAANNRKPRIQAPPRRNSKAPGVGSLPPPYAAPERITQLQAPAVQHDTCLGYYDVSGQLDKEFSCNNTDHRFCCGSCFLRFCCADRGKRLDQRICTNYNTPDWIKTQPPSPAPTGDSYDPELDRTNATVYISCGAVALVIAIGIAAKVAYDKATKPPQEMNVHRALADIMKQQGISQYDNENMTTVDTSPKDDTPARTSKNHYTPVHSNHGHYGKDNLLPGGQDMHDFISSGFVTIGRGHFKAQRSVDESSWHGDVDLAVPFGNHHHDFQHSHLDLTTPTPKRDWPQRMNNILTAATEPYDLSLSGSFQNLSRLQLKNNLSDKDMDEYYPRTLHHPDFHAPSHMVKLSTEPQSHHQRQRPRGRVQRAMSQDHMLSPPRTPRRDRDSYGLSSYGAMASAAYGSSRNLSKEQLLSVDRLQSPDFLSVERPRSQDPLLLSPARRRDKFQQKAMSRAMSHADMLMPTTPVHDRHKVPKLHAQMSTFTDSYSTLSVNHLQPSQQSTSKRQAFASRRTHTVDHMSYMTGHAYRSASKNEVTV